MPRLQQDDNGHPIQAVDQGTSFQRVTLSLASAQSSLFQAGTKIVRLCADVDCWYLFGTNPTAVAGTAGTYLPAKSPEYRRIPAGASLMVAAIAGGAGNLDIEEIA